MSLILLVVIVYICNCNYWILLFVIVCGLQDVTATNHTKGKVTIAWMGGRSLTVNS